MKFAIVFAAMGAKYDMAILPPDFEKAVYLTTRCYVLESGKRPGCRASDHPEGSTDSC